MNFVVTYWVEFLFGFLISIVTYLIKKVTDYQKILASTTRGVEVLLKSKIIETYTYYKSKGKVSIYEKEMIDELYNEYRNLAGNGVIDTLKNDIDKIPLTSEEE